MISTSKEKKMYKTRKALTSLQYSPKGQDIAGIPTKNLDLKVKLVFLLEMMYFRKLNFVKRM